MQDRTAVAPTTRPGRLHARVACGCGRSEVFVADDEDSAIGEAHRVAAAIDLDCADGGCHLRVEIVRSIPLGLFSMRGVPEHEARRYLRLDPCAYCGGPSRVLDHIVARKLGGPNGVENLTAACARCNSSKGPLSLLGFLLRRAWRPYLDDLPADEYVDLMDTFHDLGWPR